MSDIQIIAIKLLLLVGLWGALWLAHKLHCSLYRWQTRDWIPLSKDTVWLADEGHTLLYPPSPVPVVIGGIMLSVGIMVLR